MNKLVKKGDCSLIHYCLKHFKNIRIYIFFLCLNDILLKYFVRDVDMTFEKCFKMLCVCWVVIPLNITIN